MSSRGSYRRHSGEFKHQLCADIRGGKIGRREALRTHSLSANLLQLWLSQYDRGDLNEEVAAASVVAEYEAKIAALERKVGQLTMEIDLLKKTPRLRLVSNSESSSIVTGPRTAPSGEDAK
ncbi:transposase [Caballeronia sp. Sq4a]|uniref:transposase n=1 Tax=Caballeronia sp. Sq4a TaxID=2878152 RepID=UPI0020BEE242|nr:transposase [Caballeronia sp. Sq4a]